MNKFITFLSITKNGFIASLVVFGILIAFMLYTINKKVNDYIESAIITTLADDTSCLKPGENNVNVKITEENINFLVNDNQRCSLTHNRFKAIDISQRAMKSKSKDYTIIFENGVITLPS